jgi:hypothetical protein
MKIITLFFSLAFAFSALAADPSSTAENPMMPSTTAAGKPAETGSDKTLLTKPIGEVCHADREKFCGDVKVGQGGVLKCMKDHEKELSPECRAQGQMLKNKIQTRKKEIGEACAKELSTICKDSKTPRAKLECLKKSSADLSEGCQDALPDFKK